MVRYNLKTYGGVKRYNDRFESIMASARKSGDIKGPGLYDNPFGKSEAELRESRKSPFSKAHPGNQESLLSAISSGNQKKIRKLERKAEMGKMIRII